MSVHRRTQLKAVEIRDHEFGSHEEEESGGYSSIARQEKQEKIRMFALDVLIGRWYWIVLGLGIGLGLGMYVLSKTPKKYTAVSVLQLLERTTGLLGGDSTNEMDLSTLEAMNTVTAHMTQMELLEKVAAREDVSSLENLVPPPVEWMPKSVGKWINFGKADVVPSSQERVELPADVLAGMIASWIEVSIRDETRLLDVSVTHTDPEVARVVANALALEYIEELSSSREEVRNTSINILGDQSAQARTNLETATGSLAIYNRAIDIHRLLDEKEAQFNQLSGRYKPKHPKMREIADAVKSLESQFLSEYEIASEALNEKDYWEPIVREMPDREKEPDRYFLIARQQLLARIGVLESEIKSSTSVFNGMLTLIEESLVDRQSDETSAKISSLARLPGGASSPNSTTLVGLFGFGGVSGGLAIAFLLAVMDNRFHTVAQFTGETGGNVLASVADLNVRHLNHAERKYLRHHPEVRDSLVEREKWDKRILFRAGVSDTNYAEMYRVLRASVSLLGSEAENKVTLFSSALPGEGKTLTSVNFAMAAAAQGRRTLLIDLDLRKPSVHKVFGLDSRVGANGGVAKCLTGEITVEEAIFRDTDVENFHMLLSGKRDSNPGELLNTSRLMALLAEVRSLYDVIVIDSAPVLPVPDTRLVAPLVDHFCIVCRANYVPKGAVKHMLSVLEDDHTEVSGFIFNGFEQKRSLRGENNTYGYYKLSRRGKALSYGYGAYGAYGSDYKD